jgi:peptide deformylase
MLLKLYQTGQPILRQSAKHVTKQQLATQKVQDMIDFMIATLRDAPGVGLAAPQVGASQQIIVMEDKPKYHDMVPKPILKEQGRKPLSLQVLVNPKLEVIDPEVVLFFEGCLSVDNYLAVVPRFKSVRVTCWDRKGNEVSFVAHDWYARILQHEIDHLRGVLYIDSMKPESFMSTKNFAMLWRKAAKATISEAFGESMTNL